MKNAAKQGRFAGTVPLLAVCALMQGCIGAGVTWSKTESFHNPAELKEVLNYSFGPTNLSEYTPTLLETKRGKPDSIRRIGKSGTDAIWTYKNDLSWNGVVLLVLIPIPLQVPIGREWTQLTIQDEHVTSMKRRRTRSVGGFVGYSIGPCGITDFGPHSINE